MKGADMANIQVAVRIRPVSSREQTLTGSEIVVHANRNEISLTNLKVSASKAGDSRERTRRYGFDHCFDSSNPAMANYASQETIYKAIGTSILDAVFGGYNSCLVAYGQSASGKTYTMMGTKDDPGLTPRLCEGLFARLTEMANGEDHYRVSVSYLEIYNEKVRDLLKPSSLSSGGLRVREHPRLGPYVQGLTHHVVRNLGALISYVEEGSRVRKTASTLQNPNSSRSHALLTVTLASGTGSSEDSVSVTASSRPTRTTSSSSASSPSSGNKAAQFPRGSKLHLVDLAGSENAATCSGIHRLKEGANINKSLVALGNVISALAERGSTGSGPGRRFIPYRDSALTWLLKDALGGNATTIMFATISPASGSYNETAHTLRFAQRAQSVINRPIVNEDPVQRIIRELRAEVARLTSLLLEKSSEDASPKICTCSCYVQPLEPYEPLAANNAIEDVPESDSAALESEDSQKPKPVSSSQRRNSICEDSLNVATVDALRKCKSLESVATAPKTSENQDNAALVRQLEVDPLQEPVFIDIPTLVAVLIKPDNHNDLGERFHEDTEDLLDPIGVNSSQRGLTVGGNLLETSREDLIETETQLDSCQLESDLLQTHCRGLVEKSSLEDVAKSDQSLQNLDLEKPGKKVGKPKLSKQSSVEVEGVKRLKKYASVEGLNKSKKEPSEFLQRSHTNVEKRGESSWKKLNNIKEIGDSSRPQRTFSRPDVGRKGSTDSGKSLPFNRKSSVESIRRKTSKDTSNHSSSSSSKDDILTGSASLSREKLNGGQQDQQSRAHTPIQRTRRAEIVAAVTQRLYSARKTSSEESSISGAVATGTLSTQTVESPESKMASSVARMRLQEISRKMLAKRRKACVETQTDNESITRVKDVGCETDELKIQEIGVLTDDHEQCEWLEGSSSSVLRVKEISTLTEKLKGTIISCKDAEVLTEDYDEVQNDSGVLSESCEDPERSFAESSTNTANFSLETGNPSIKPSQIQISITIDAPCRDPRVRVDSRQGLRLKDCEVQTERSEAKDVVVVQSNGSQTDNRIFRIENIFETPAQKIVRSQSSSSLTGTEAPKSPLTLTKSVGTNITEMIEGFLLKKHLQDEGLNDVSYCKARFRTVPMTKPPFLPRKRWTYRRDHTPIGKPNALEEEETKLMDDEAKGTSFKKTGNPNKLFLTLEDPFFSDDSLDNNDQEDGNSCYAKPNSEKQCPPDVVAHTKKKDDVAKDNIEKKQDYRNLEYPNGSPVDSSGERVFSVNPAAFEGQPGDDGVFAAPLCEFDGNGNVKRECRDAPTIGGHSNDPKSLGGVAYGPEEIFKSYPAAGSQVATSVRICRNPSEDQCMLANESTGVAEAQFAETPVIGDSRFDRTLFPELYSVPSAGNFIPKTFNEKSIPKDPPPGIQSRVSVDPDEISPAKGNHREILNDFPSTCSHPGSCEFENTYVEFPRTRPKLRDPLVSGTISDYRSLILGCPKVIRMEDNDEDRGEVKPELANNKKRVSFSSDFSSIDRPDAKWDFKPIIKNRHLKLTDVCHQNYGSSSDFCTGSWDCHAFGQRICGLPERNVLDRNFRNMNSMNECYMSADNGRRGCQDELPFLMPLESYERCLKGIAKLDNCIHKVERHNELLRMKYGNLMVSADAKLHLANSSSAESKFCQPFIRQNGSDERPNNWTPSRGQDFRVTDKTTNWYQNGLRCPQRRGRRNQRPSTQASSYWDFRRSHLAARGRQKRNVKGLRIELGDKTSVDSDSATEYENFEFELTGKDKLGDSRSSSYDNVSSSFEFEEHPGDKLKYPGSPRAKFLELLSERRRIVRNSRSNS